MTTDLLKKMFLADAALCAAVFLAGVLATASLAAATGLAPGIVAAAGWICLAAAALLAWLGSRTVPPASVAWLAVLLNLGWVAASIAVFEIDYGSLTALGRVLVPLQAAGVLLFALAEGWGARGLGARRTAAA